MRNRLLATSCTLLPPLVLYAWMYRFGITVPYWDHWDFVPILAAWSDGTLTLPDLLRPHNAHRPFFPYLLMLALAAATGWQVGYELVVNAVLGIAIAALWFVLLRRVAAADRLALRAWLPLAVSVTVFSMAQWRNWLWGWQLQVFLCAAAVLLALALLTRPGGGGAPAFIGACVASFVASYSFGAGLAVWPAGIVAIYFGAEREIRNRRLAAWTAAGLGTALLYLFVVGQPGRAPGMPTPDYADGWHALFLPAALGSGVVAYSGVLAFVAGIAGLVLMAALLRPLLREPDWARTVAPFAAFAAFALGAALLTTIGRGHEGLYGAVESRYTTLTLPFWLALMSLLGMGERRQPTRWRLPLMLALIAAIGINSLHGARVGSLRDPLQEKARQAILTNGDPAILEGLYPVPERFERRRAELRRIGLGPFQP